ncbi:thioredoxin family protein [Bradyrhizobium japonicum]|uniref:thioredoxin family protein n=1 Tax=Bradyrhizobium japonicum TaxID=375 RepID=UPI0020A10D53|nr:thioredoxin family protein [Bradyrhizobium japonicum]MCP1761884.1 thiol-disulfide isomerase/thioredoxin [Bradyrhizobium japonicum]MCP1793464.1 thiol-disulfide isomerase/thioredoxin [Bradyrhizobium japonicum]MCP1805897.1 thiol-disulfide isomerase/thioredoxin [Bradyrhizobium japonicum]MCP1814914.1 thiol-disulfide isomerase/thioredoxin [Bradyrhizobium japonicum]MCP1873657.1 thiol-disulfide isomerase/thioredoxin [Bradyrhizobium japonicum]
MTFKLLAVSAALISMAVTGAVIPGICGEAARATPVVTAAASRQTAPDFTGINNWFNSKPLRIADLRGKVVLVDFWTYGCVNCVNTLPHVTDLYAKYKDKGLVVVGVHTPEFPFERSAANVQAALKRHGITYPVAQDNDSKTWNAYQNQYWPAQYIIDQSGKIVFQHEGEGRYDEIDRTVAKLLNANS